MEVNIIEFELNTAVSRSVGTNLMRAEYPNHCVYFGQFNGDLKPTGFGKSKFKSISTEYSGEFYNGEYRGFCIIVDFNYGHSFEGIAMRNELNGIGIEVWRDRSNFKGLYSSNDKVLGRYEWPDGSYYEGELKDNSFHGYVSYLRIIIGNSCDR